MKNEDSPSSGSLSTTERQVLSAGLLAIATLTGIDLFEDALEGVTVSHVLIEAGITLFALGSAYYLLRDWLSFKAGQQKLMEKKGCSGHGRGS